MLQPEWQPRFASGPKKSITLNPSSNHVERMEQATIRTWLIDRRVFDQINEPINIDYLLNTLHGYW